MNLKRIVVFALLVSASAPSNAAPYNQDQVVPEATPVPDTSLLEISPKTMPRNDPVANEEHVSRAQPCADDHACTFDVLFNVDGGTAMPNTDVFLPGRTLTNVKYTVQVTPDKAPYGAKVWNLKGVRLLANDNESADKDASTLFQQCRARLVQGSTRGDVLAVIHMKHTACPEQLSNLLISSVKSLVPVKGHASQTELFSHRELVGTDDRRVDYTTHSTGEHTHIHGRVFHRHFNDEVLLSSKELEDFHKELSKHATATKTHVIGNTLHEHHSFSKVRLAAVEGSREIKNPEALLDEDSLQVPDGATGGAEARRQEDLLQHVYTTAKKVQTKKWDTPVTIDEGVDEFLQRATEAGNEVHDLSYHPYKAQEKENPFLKLNGEQQSEFFDKLVAELPELLQAGLTKVAQAKCDQVLGTPQGQQIFLENLNNGQHYELHTSALLLGGMDRARPLPTDALLSIANNEKFARHTRQQSMLSLIQDECFNANHHLRAIDGLANLANAVKHDENTGMYELGAHTTALMVQHVLAQQGTYCSKGAAVSAVTNLLQSTEQFARDSLARKDWDGVEFSLLALANSGFERHRHVVKAVQADPETPKKVLMTADWVDSKLPKSPALAEAEVSAKGKLQYQFSGKQEFKVPKDPVADKNGHKAPDPRFQAQFEAGWDAGMYDAGNDDGSVQFGATTYAKASVKIWDDSHVYGLIKIALEFKIPNSDYKSGARPQLKVYIGPKDYCIYMWPKSDVDKTVKDKVGGDTTIEISGQKDNVGYCGTDIKTMNGFKGEIAFDKTLFKFDFQPPIPIGPVPLTLGFKIESVIKFEIGLGPSGTKKQAVSRECGGAQKKVESKKYICGDAGNDVFKGALGFIQPSFELNVYAEASVNVWIAKTGAGLKITILKIAVPATVEAFKEKTPSKPKPKWGYGWSMRVSNSAGDGTFYFFFEWDTWFTSGRKQWDIISWTGFGWTYPEGKELWGKIDAVVAMPKCSTPPMPDPSDTDCQVVTFQKFNLKGEEKYRYYTSASSTSGKLINLPNPVQDNVMSAQTFGNCKSVEFVDDDNGYGVGNNNNAILWDANIVNLPYDLQNDVRSVNIIALPPACPNGKCPDPKPETDWNKFCHAVVYTYTNFIGWNYHMWRNDNTCGHFKKNLYVQSIEISPGCQKIWVQDDDYYNDDTFFSSSQASLNNDLTNDIASYKLYPKTGASSCQSAEETEAEQNLVQLFAQKAGDGGGNPKIGAPLGFPKKKPPQKPPNKKGEKKNAPDPALDDKCVEAKGQCCWKCWPKGSSVYTPLFAFAESHCWKGNPKQDKYKCKATPIKDQFCQCTKHMASVLQRQKEFKKKQDAAICAGCGMKLTGSKKKKCQAECKASGSPATCSSHCSTDGKSIDWKKWSKKSYAKAKAKEEMEWFLESFDAKKAAKKAKKKASHTAKAPAKKGSSTKGSSTTTHLSKADKEIEAAEKAAEAKVPKFKKHEATAIGEPHPLPGKPQKELLDDNVEEGSYEDGEEEEEEDEEEEEEEE